VTPQIEVTPQRRSQRPAHRKVLRPKDVSYSESILQDFRSQEIPPELASLYDLQEQIGAGTTSKVGFARCLNIRF
jgi:hypothetical protein